MFRMFPLRTRDRCFFKSVYEVEDIGLAFVFSRHSFTPNKKQSGPDAIRIALLASEDKFSPFRMICHLLNSPFQNGINTLLAGDRLTTLKSQSQLDFHGGRYEFFDRYQNYS